MQRFGRVLYWFGLIVGGFLLLMNIVPFSVMLGILPGVEGGQPWIGVMFHTFFGCLVWGVCWGVRYLTTGAVSLSPFDKGWYSDVTKRRD